jgi:hypothetical protein
MGQDGLEGALTATAERVHEALRSSAGTARELKRAASAAASGSVRDLRRALDAAAGAAQELARVTSEAQDSYTFDDTAHLRSGAYGGSCSTRPPSRVSRCSRRTSGCSATPR